MSLILEALNRSTQDRHAETGPGVPGLDTPAYVEQLAEVKPWTALIPWLALLASIVIIGFLLIDKFWAGPEVKRSVAATDTVQTASAQGAAVAGITQTQPQPQQSIAQRPAAEHQPQPKSLPEKTPAADRRKTDAAVAALYGRQSKPSVTAVEVAPEQAPEEATISAAETPIDMAQLLASTEAGLKNARLQEHPAPFIADLSQQKKDGIPSILYRNHDFSSNPAQSSVVLNGKRLKVGQQVANGVKLDEILPDSIVLNQRGEQFRLRALNSWVNL